MITPSFALTATECVLPRLALDFTTAILDSRVIVTRLDNTATRINSSGAIEIVNANLPRFDYDPVTLICKGLLIEESRKNLLLNTDSLATQNVTVTAAAHTLTFYGTGEIVLSGTHSATVTGTGVYPSRKTYVFTPTAGTLTVTITGTVQYAQIELGGFATSYIPNANSQNTRNADVAVLSGTSFSSWYNASEGAFAVNVISGNDNNDCRYITASDGTVSNFIALIGANSGATSFNFMSVTTSGTSQMSAGGAVSYIANTAYSVCGAYKTNDCVISRNTQTTPAFTDTTVNLPTVNRMYIGSRYDGGGSFFNGWISKIRYWPQRIINNETVAFSR